MKNENLVNAMGHIDEDLVARAESHSAGRAADKQRHYKHTSFRFAFAACVAVILTISVTVAFATGLIDSLMAYFSGETELYLEEILSAVDSASNEDVELRIDGAIADEHTCHIIVSFIGLTEESQRKIAEDDLGIQDSFDTYAVLENGEYYYNFMRESATYTEKTNLGKKAKTMFGDADQTYIYTYELYGDDGISMNDIKTLCFAYEGLVLEVDVQQYVSEERNLYAENSDGTEQIVDFYASRIGFYFTAILDDDFDDTFDIKLIYANGTVDEYTGRDLGYQLSFGYNTEEDKITYVSGCWGGESIVSIGIIDLADYCGIQVNGINYYFANE